MAPDLLLRILRRDARRRRLAHRRGDRRGTWGRSRMTAAANRTLAGYTLPLSPTGGSSLVPAPPWHFSGDVLVIEYRADPAAIRAFLPPGLEARELDGLAAAIFGGWQ